jgi:hypothetical protein
MGIGSIFFSFFWNTIKDGNIAVIKSELKSKIIPGIEIIDKGCFSIGN